MSYDSAITKLLAHNVNVAIGVLEDYDARNTRFEIARVSCCWIMTRIMCLTIIQAALDSNGRIGGSQAIALASTNLERALGLKLNAHTDTLGFKNDDLVVYEGGSVLDMHSKVLGVLSSRRGITELFI